MSEPTACAAARCHPSPSYCDSCDLLVGLECLHVTSVEQDDAGLVVMVESAPAPMGCPGCGVVAYAHGRVTVELVDLPCFERPVRLRWVKRRWSCAEPVCATGTFVEQDETVARPRGLLTVRACWWAIEQIRREHASVAGVARQLGCSWKTVWRSIRPLLEALDADPARFDGVATLGVDEHVWHHVSPLKRGPKELTGMVDLTRHPDPKDPDKLIVRARLLDLVPGRSGTVYRNWLIERGDAFRAGVQVATLDPFHGYKNAIDDQLDEAASVLDAFHVVKLGGQALDEIRRRVQQAIHGHRGRKGDPLYGIRNILRLGLQHLSEKQRARIEAAFAADERHDEVHIAWQAVHQLRSAYTAKDLAAGKKIALKVIDSFPSCPIPEIARLGRTLRRWRAEFLAYFDTARSSNGGTEAINGLIELHRRIARGFRNRHNYRLRMLLIGGGLIP
ncbi:transposase [Humibacillus xanthopallidus]|uniref:Transposase n=1 Tax=Humibacillus xanthopallidus TaxID=412689 RepID=A0A543PQC1_9MICO|nr:transposase [Humibacillus xanthopallidus]